MCVSDKLSVALVVRLGSVNIGLFGDLSLTLMSVAGVDVYQRQGCFCRLPLSMSIPGDVARNACAALLGRHVDAPPSPREYLCSRRVRVRIHARQNSHSRDTVTHRACCWHLLKAGGAVKREAYCPTVPAMPN